MPALPRRLYRYNTTKAHKSVTTIRGAVGAIRSKQVVGVAIAPRRAAQHTSALKNRQIFAPLPYVASHIVQTTKILLKASHWTSPWVAVVIAFNHLEVDGLDPVFCLFPGVIPSSSRRRPAFVPFPWDVPRKELDLATLLCRGTSYLILQSHRGAPFFVIRQPVFSVFRQISRISLAFRQPLTEFLRVIPTNAHHRMGSSLAKPGFLPCRIALLLPPLLANRVHASRRIVAGTVHEHLKVLYPCIPDAE